MPMIMQPSANPKGTKIDTTPDPGDEYYVLDVGLVDRLIKAHRTGQWPPVLQAIEAIAKVVETIESDGPVAPPTSPPLNDGGPQLNGGAPQEPGTPTDDPCGCHPKDDA